MKQNPFPFVAGSYNSRSPRFDCQRTVNLYAEMSGSGTSKTIAMLIGTPGTRTVGTYSDFAPPGKFLRTIRGMLKISATRAIIVCGAGVGLIDETMTPVQTIGAINELNTPVSMATNGLQVMIVTGAEGYFIDLSTYTITQIMSLDFHGATIVQFIKGYFVFNWPGTQKYQWTDLYSTTINPLSFASAEGSPDSLLSLIVDHNELWLHGETSTEVHIVSGNADGPFEPIQGAFMEQGCAAAYSVAKLTDQNGAGTVCWLTANASGQGMVMRTVGYQARRISDHALEFAIAGYIKTSRIDDAIAYTYQQEGHSFYMLSFPTANKSWCYDFATELWHERSWRNPETGTDNRHRSFCHMSFAGKTLVGDHTEENVYEFDLDLYTDGPGGGPIVAIRQCPHLSLGDVFQIFHELWVDMETGVGKDPVTGTVWLPPSVGVDPVLTIEWSDDGGHTFPYARTVRIGRMGERKMRAAARRLGKSKDRVFRVSISDPVKRIFLGAGVRMTPEAA